MSDECYDMISDEYGLSAHPRNTVCDDLDTLHGHTHTNITEIIV